MTEILTTPRSNRKRAGRFCPKLPAIGYLLRGSVCWHTHEAYDYAPTAGVVVHPDNWRWGAHEHYSWREHEGRGYWNGDKWMDR